MSGVSGSSRFDTLAQRVRFILVEPSHPGNVGAAARAIKTMGFAELVLVKPRHADVLSDPEARAMASGADDVLAAARIVDSLDIALTGVQWSLALSARPREYGPPLLPPRDAAPQAVQAMATGGEAALVFGNERTGLANEDVERCTAIAHIPANPVYSSLNLAQAIQVLAYELRLACLDEVFRQAAQDRPNAPPVDDARRDVDKANEGGAGAAQARGVANAGVSGLAASDEIEGMYRHLETALVDIAFLDPSNPKKLMSRLRRLFARAGLEREEVNILRGIAKHILARRESR